MTLDILFISYNRRSEVEKNLSILLELPGVDHVIWVDNGSTDGTTTIVCEHDRLIKLLLPENIGIEAFNRGGEKSNADILVLLDDDSHIIENAVQKTKSYFEKDPTIGALAYQIILPHSGEIVTDDWPVGPCTYFWGCGAAVLKSVWDELGGYRKELFLYGNEYDYCIRVWNLGYKVIYVDDITAYHRVSSMNRTSERLVSYSLRNNYLYIKRYFSKKYQRKLFFYDRLTWYIRSLLSNSLKGYQEGKEMIAKLDSAITVYPIKPEIQKFYVDNQRIFESPVKKIIRKLKHKKLLKISKNV